MIPGLLSVFRDSGIAAICVASADDASLAWFITEPGDVRTFDWLTFYRDLCLCGFHEPLSHYRFTSEERAIADMRAGVFVDALAFAAFSGAIVTRPKDF